MTGLFSMVRRRVLLVQMQEGCQVRYMWLCRVPKCISRCVEALEVAWGLLELWNFRELYHGDTLLSCC